MKKPVLFIAALAISHAVAFSQACLPDSASAQVRQGCLPEGIYFTTQEQIDNFQTNYPGCTEIEGDITIQGSITNLNGLSVLTSIGGYLWIKHNNALTRLTGLENLDSIGGDLYLWNNNLLDSLTDLDKLASIGGDLWIYSNPALTSLAGLDSLTSIGGDLSIQFNPALISLSGLCNLASIGGKLIIESNISLSTCEAAWLCDYISDPDGSIIISDNAAGCISVIELANACGGSVPCLPFGNYNFSSQNDIDTFPLAFPGCTELQGHVAIEGSEITNLNGLENLTSTGGNLTIRTNNALASLTGLDNLTSIGDGLLITSNDALTSLTGLDNLASIGGHLDILGNNAVTSLTGLDNLTSIGGRLYIGFTNVLNSLAGLENLTSIGGFLLIDLNDSLTSLTGLENIDAGSLTNILITGNKMLSGCSVKSICDYLAGSNVNIFIDDNAPGCNSPEEVEEACNDVSIESIGFEDDYLLFPNPAGKTITISGNNGAAIREIFIYNQTGQKVRHSKPINNTLDISKLRPGIYIVELVTEKGKVRKKLIVE